MKPLAEFYDFLLPELPGCTTLLLDHHLRQVAREFCDKTCAWRLPYDSISLYGGTSTYEIDTPEFDSELVKLYSLNVAGRTVWRDSDREVEGDDCPTYRRDQPPFELSPDLDLITLHRDLVPTGDIENGLKVVGSMKPTQGATKLPDFLKSQYSEAIRFGVLSRLMVMGKKPWTDLALAGLYDGRWHGELNFAAYQVQVGNTRAQLRVKKWG